MLDKVKTALRVTTTAYDVEIEDYIDAAKLDLGLAGVDSGYEESLPASKTHGGFPAQKASARARLPNPSSDARASVA